jgi:hypothetical protein
LFDFYQPAAGEATADICARGAVLECTGAGHGAGKWKTQHLSIFHFHSDFSKYFRLFLII